MAANEQILTNARRKMYLISRHGFALRVTKDGKVEGSVQGPSDPFSKSCSYLQLLTFSFHKPVQAENKHCQ